MGFSTALAIAQGAIAVGGAIKGASDAANIGNKQARSVVENFLDNDREGTRRQERINEISSRQKQDRKRLSDQEEATISVIASERNLSVTTRARLSAAEAYAEGLDLSRIEDNRENDVDAIQAFKNRGHAVANAQLGTIQRGIDQAHSAAIFTALTGGLNAAATGLQIQSRGQAREGAIERSQNLRRS